MVLPGKGMGWKEFFVALKTEWTRDNASNVAGAVTFFGVLAIFPFLLFLVALASVIIDPQQANQLIEQLREVAPPQVADILGEQLTRLGQQQNSGLLTFGALAAIWAASGGMVALMDALNTVYGVEEKRPFWKQRGTAILMTLIAGAIGVVSAATIIALPPLAEHLPGVLGEVLLWLRLPVAGAIMMFLWAVMYYVLPDVEQSFKFITPGSVFGVLVWLLASYGFSVYVRNFGNYEATYGALGGVIVMLFWMWISSQVLLLGAEINGILEHKSEEGKKPGAKSMKDTGAAGTKTQEEDRDSRRLLPAPTAVGRAVSIEDRPKRSKVWSTLALLLAAVLERRRPRRPA